MIYSLYSKTTGLFTGTILNCPEPYLDQNIPEGQSCLLGLYDPLREKVDPLTGSVGDYQPPSPSVNHVWEEETKTWVYIKTEEDLAREARARRNQLLSEVDWVTLRAYRTNTSVPEPFATYQQALADIPTQAGFPRDIIWPTPPTE